MWLLKAGLVACGLATILLSAGVTFGWTPLEVVLKREGLYSNITAAERDTKLEIVVSLGLFASNFGGVFAGALLDAVGPAMTNFIATLSFVVGCVMFGWEISLVIGYMLMALGGAGVLAAGFRLSLVFPRLTSVMMTCVSGAFDSSTVVFAAFNFLNKSEGIGLKSLFSGLAFLIVIVQALLITLWVIYYKERSLAERGLLVRPADDQSSVHESMPLFNEHGKLIEVDYGTRSERGLTEVSLPDDDAFNSIHGSVDMSSSTIDSPDHPSWRQRAALDNDTPEDVALLSGKHKMPSTNDLLFHVKPRQVVTSALSRSLSEGLSPDKSATPPGPLRNGGYGSTAFSKTLLASPGMLPTQARAPGDMGRLSLSELDGVLLDKRDDPNSRSLDPFNDVMMRSRDGTPADNVTMSEYNRPETTVYDDDFSEAPSTLPPKPGIPVVEWSFKQQVKSKEFRFLLAFTSINMFHTAWYLSTTQPYLSSLGDTNHYYSGIVSAIMPTELVWIPAVSYILHHVPLYRGA